MVIEYVHEGRTPANQRVLARLAQASRQLRDAGVDVLDPVALSLIAMAGE
jgi:hypothetical protein